MCGRELIRYIFVQIRESVLCLVGCVAYLKRIEDFWCQTKRHPFRIHVPLGGRLENIAKVDNDSVEFGLLDEQIAWVAITQTDEIPDH